MIVNFPQNICLVYPRGVYLWGEISFICNAGTSFLVFYTLLSCCWPSPSVVLLISLSSLHSQSTSLPLSYKLLSSKLDPAVQSDIRLSFSPLLSSALDLGLLVSDFILLAFLPSLAWSVTFDLVLIGFAPCSSVTLTLSIRASSSNVISLLLSPLIVYLHHVF